MMNEAISHKQAMKDRIEAKRKYLEARMTELKASTRSNAAEEIDRIKSTVRDLKEAAKHDFDTLSVLDRTPG